MGEEYIKRFRIIPFSSIGKQNGLMLGIKADKLVVENEYENKDEKKEGKIVKKNIIIGISKHKLDKFNKYNALIGLELLEEGSEENEFITNFKG